MRISRCRLGMDGTGTKRGDIIMDYSRDFSFLFTSKEPMMSWCFNFCECFLPKMLLSWNRSWNVLKILQTFIIMGSIINPPYLITVFFPASLSIYLRSIFQLSDDPRRLWLFWRPCPFSRTNSHALNCRRSATMAWRPSNFGGDWTDWTMKNCWDFTIQMI